MTATRPYPQIIITGDSISLGSFKTGGYGSFLVDQYAAKADVVSRGMGGYTSRQLLHKFKTDFHVPGEGKVLLFIIHIGTNDCVVSGPQKVPIDEYKSNLSSIISHLHLRHPSSSILLLTPSVFHAPAAQALHSAVGIDYPNDRTDDSARAYAEACIEVAGKEGVPVVDCWKVHRGLIDGGVEGWKLLPDGLHYSAKGYAPLNTKILETITTSFPHLNPTSLPESFDFFLSYALNTPGGNSPDEVAKALKKFEKMDQETWPRMMEYIKRLEESDK